MLLSVEQDTEAQLATRAAALSDALHGSVQQAATQEWRALDCGAALKDARDQLAAAQAAVGAVGQEGLLHKAEAARLAAKLNAAEYVDEWRS